MVRKEGFKSNVTKDEREKQGRLQATVMCRRSRRFAIRLRNVRRESGTEKKGGEKWTMRLHAYPPPLLRSRKRCQVVKGLPEDMSIGIMPR